MISKITSCVSVGLDCLPVEVEVDVSSQGLSSFTIVGLGDKAIEEAKERVRSAIRNSGFFFPSHHITVNLAPADFPKVGSGFDLAIAMGLLLASGQIAFTTENSLFIGELSLDGQLRSTPGILSIISFAKQRNFQQVYLPLENCQEASIIQYFGIYPVGSLKQLYDHLGKIKEIVPLVPSTLKNSQETTFEFDLMEIKGQEQAKRALEIAAAGGHNLIFKGPPGSGKTMLARTLPSILPAMTREEEIEVTKIYSICGLLKNEEPLINQRPFRAPHHTISHISLVGGGQNPKPGEISLAHRGVLFLDEASEFSRQALESLRQPLEDGFVTISRVKGTLSFPAKFIFVAACNPCPCGYLGTNGLHHCSCSPGQILRYQKKISGPLLDRVDLYLSLQAVEANKLTQDEFIPENSFKVKKRVELARDRQRKRFSKTMITCNAEMKNADLRKYCEIKTEAQNLLKEALIKFGLSARSYQKTIKVAKTVADLEGTEVIDARHLTEALHYRKRIEEY
ncbi:YifB family Mg chelatase-like AAA ATPase [Candidatus Microgenomates bacterium]|nr:YifB family Mg chelatase-like AAA ATPase [Candidatus Microgenomates bacterium]